MVGFIIQIKELNIHLNSTQDHALSNFEIKNTIPIELDYKVNRYRIICILLINDIL